MKRNKLLFQYILISIALIVFISILYAFMMRHIVREQMISLHNEKTDNAVKALFAGSPRLMGFISSGHADESVSSSLEAFKKSLGFLRIRIWNGKGAFIWCDGERIEKNFIPRTAEFSAAMGGGGAYRIENSFEGSYDDDRDEKIIKIYVRCLQAMAARPSLRWWSISAR
jgi:hypothetical protein